MANGAGAMVSVRLTDLLCTGLPESDTVKVRAVLATAAEGVPVMEPDVPFRVRPAGRWPALRDQP